MFPRSTGMILVLLVSSFTYFLPATGQAQGFSEKRSARVDSFIQHYISEGRLNGAVGIITQNGKTIYSKAFGYSNLEKKTPMEKDAIFRLASMTKPIVSVGIMMLWEEGKFSLEDPVSKFIPAFKNTAVLDKFNANDTSFTTVPAKRQITIRHLLSHTSGIGYPGIGSNFAKALYAKYRIDGGIGTPNGSLKDMMTKLAALPVFHQPGEKYTYGLNTDLLGHLIEVVSGMPLDKFLQQRIFAPLGMKDTYFYLPAEKASRLVPMYLQEPVKGKAIAYNKQLDPAGLANFPLATNGSYFSGGAGLSSTAPDYVRFAQMLCNGGELDGVRILSPHTIRLMTTNQISDYAMFDGTDQTRRFGLGFGLYLDQAMLTLPVGYGSFEWDGMFATHFWVDPKNKLVVVFMRNVYPTPDWDFKDRVKPLVYQALE